jgi:hypothetical protein
MYHIIDSAFGHIISSFSSSCSPGVSDLAWSHIGDRGGFAHPALAFSQSTHSRHTPRITPATGQQNRDQIVNGRNLSTRPAATSNTRDSNQRGTPAADFSDSSTSDPSSQTQSSLSSIQSDRNQLPPLIHPVPLQPQTITPAPLTTSPSDSYDMQQVKMFKGMDRHKQNPQNWLLKLEGAKFRYNTPDEQCLYTFSKHLKYGSKAHIWWRDELTINVT